MTGLAYSLGWAAATLRVLEWLTGITAGILLLRWDVRRRPYAKCFACRRNPRRNTGSTIRAWGRCPVCHGSGERRRLLTYLFGMKG